MSVIESARDQSQTINIFWSNFPQTALPNTTVSVLLFGPISRRLCCPTLQSALNFLALFLTYCVAQHNSQLWNFWPYFSPTVLPKHNSQRWTFWHYFSLTALPNTTVSVELFGPISHLLLSPTLESVLNFKEFLKDPVIFSENQAR